MIGRLWHGYTKPEDADSYERLLLESILPGIYRISGYRGGYVLRKETGDETEFITLTLWDSLDAIRQFAGDDYERCVISPEAGQLLTRHDAKSAHYKLMKSD